MARPAKSVWTLETRKMLKELTMEGYTKQEIQEITGWTYFYLTNELKRGLSISEYKSKKYLKYDINRAMLKEFEENFDEEDTRLIVKEYLKTYPDKKDEIIAELQEEAQAVKGEPYV